MICVFNDDCVSGGNVDFCFDNGSIYQYVKMLMVEIIYDLFQFMFVYLFVVYSDLCFWYQFCQLFCGFLNIFDVIV